MSGDQVREVAVAVTEFACARERGLGRVLQCRLPIYGGRQLRKSAMLDHIRRDIAAPEHAV